MIHYYVWNFVFEALSIIAAISTCIFLSAAIGYIMYVSIYWMKRAADRSIELIDSKDTEERKFKV